MARTIGLPGAGRLLICAVAAAVLLAGSPSVRADDGGYPATGGYVFTATAGDAASSGAGYLISDDDGIPFWSEFQRLGGVPILGYPVSQRFTWNGFVTQALQKLVLQWRPDRGAVVFINVFDDLSAAGYDAELAGWLIPPATPFDEAGLTWNAVVRGRLALLDASAPLRSTYDAQADALRWFGLPTSPVVTYPGVRVIRLQRAALQLWTSDMPWAKAGQVTVANGGDLAKRAGLFPTAAMAPRVVGARDDPIVVRANQARAALGLPPLRQSPELMQAAQAHAAYYVRNLGDPNAGGLHREIVGKPGFTGARIYDRAQAAGYPLNWIDETFGFLPPRGTLDWALGTVFHRYMFLHPSAVDIGYGSATVGRTTATIFNVGLAPDRTAQVPLPSVDPPNGGTDIPPVWDGAESPDPAPGVPRPLGPPVTLQFGLGDTIIWGRAQLLDPAGAEVPTVRSTSDWRRALAMVPADPLAAGTRYTVRVSGERNGVRFTFESQFTTRP